MSPTALTATIAATMRPFGRAIEALPMPAFIDRPGPPSLPTVAPAPAPTDPSVTAALVAAAAALYPQSAVGRIFGLPPTPRSKRIAAGTIGTRDGPAGQPMLCSSSHRTVPVAASRPNALPPDKTIAFTLSTMLSGLSRSISRVPGAPPRCETPPTASPSTTMTVHPVGRSVSV